MGLLVRWLNGQVHENLTNMVKSLRVLAGEQKEEENIKIKLGLLEMVTCSNQVTVKCESGIRGKKRLSPAVLFYSVKYSLARRNLHGPFWFLLTEGLSFSLKKFLGLTLSNMSAAKLFALKRQAMGCIGKMFVEFSVRQLLVFHARQIDMFISKRSLLWKLKRNEVIYSAMCKLYILSKK